MRHTPSLPSAIGTGSLDATLRRFAKTHVLFFDLPWKLGPLADMCLITYFSKTRRFIEDRYGTLITTAGPVQVHFIPIDVAEEFEWFLNEARIDLPGDGGCVLPICATSLDVPGLEGHACRVIWWKDYSAADPEVVTIRQGRN